MWTFLPWDTLYSTTYHNKFFLEVMCHDLNLIRNWVDCNFRNLDLYYHYCCRYDIQMSWGCCPIGFLYNRVGWNILCFLLYLEKKVLRFRPVYNVLILFQSMLISRFRILKNFYYQGGMKSEVSWVYENFKLNTIS